MGASGSRVLRGSQHPPAGSWGWIPQNIALGPLKGWDLLHQTPSLPQKNGIWGLTLPKCRQLLLGFGVSARLQISALRCPGEEFTGKWLKKEKKEIKHRLAISELGQAGHLAGWSCQEKGTEEPASFPLQIARPNEIFRASRLRFGELEEPVAGWGQLVLVPNMGTPWYPSWGRPLPVVDVPERCKHLGAWSTPGWGRHQGHREWDHWEHPAGGADTRRPQKSREAESSHQARLFCQGLIRLVTGREEPARFPPLIPPESFLSAVPALKKKSC